MTRFATSAAPRATTATLLLLALGARATQLGNLHDHVSALSGTGHVAAETSGHVSAEIAADGQHEISISKTTNSKSDGGLAATSKSKSERSESESTAAQWAEALAKRPMSAGWFGGFDQQESTYTEEGLNAELRVKGQYDDAGWMPSRNYPKKHPQVNGAEWFDESPSADGDAWQTHYPALGASVSGNRVPPNHWSATPEGWVQDYKPAVGGSGTRRSANAHQAEWFDSSVLNYDGFGRRNLPNRGTPRRLDDSGYGQPWTERSVNTTITCPTRGCTATVNLQAFNTATEDASQCRLSIGVHATDFDDSWGQEGIRNFRVNNYLVDAMCDPHARGCNATAWRPLWPCLNSYSADHIINATGGLTIEATIDRLVDECPFEGNLLSGVASITCMVRPKLILAPGGIVSLESTDVTTQLTLPIGVPAPNYNDLANTMVNFGMPAAQAVTATQALIDIGLTPRQAFRMANGVRSLPYDVNVTDVLTARDLPHGYQLSQLNPDLQMLRMATYGVDANATMRCRDPGCRANALINIDPAVALMGGSCLMSVSVVETDFDDTSELVEFLHLEDRSNAVNPNQVLAVLSNASVGATNPCLNQMSGNSSSAALNRTSHMLVTGFNVTEQLLAMPRGSLRLQGKITDTVDECHYNDALFHAQVAVHCSPPTGSNSLATFAMLQEETKSPLLSRPRATAQSAATLA